MEPNTLRYLDAGRVRCPSGRLAGFSVCTDDAQPLGIIDGVVIDAARGRLAYLVLLFPGVLLNRRFLLAVADGAVFEDDARILRISARRCDLRLVPFQHPSIPPLTEDDGPLTVRARDAA